MLFTSKILRTSLYGRKAPVHLLVPSNYFEQTVEYDPLTPDSYRLVSDDSVDRDKITAIVHELRNAKKPIFFIGHRSWYPSISEVIHNLSQTFGIPVVLSASAKGLFNEFSPYFGGIFDLYGHRSAEVLIKQSDLVISIGEDFGEFSTNKYEPDLFNNKLIQIDVDGYDIGRNYPVKLSTCGNLVPILSSLYQEMKNASLNPFFDSSLKEIIAHENKAQLLEMSDDSSPLKPQRIFKEISDRLPENSIVIGDIGANGYFSLRNLKVNVKGYSISMCNYTLGQGVAGSIGAKLAEPDKTILTICGDGALLMNGMEIATACHYKIPIILIVFVDDCYGVVDYTQKLLYNDLDFCTHFTVPDLSKFAASFDIDFYRVSDLASLKESLSNAFKNNMLGKSILIEVRFDTDELLPTKPRAVKFFQDFGTTESLAANPYLMKSFKRMLREKV